MQEQHIRLDRSVLTIGDLRGQDAKSEARYWLTRSPAERLMALEQLRMRLANYDNITSRLQRFYTITELTSG